MKESQWTITLDKYEHGAVIAALNDMRNQMLEDERPTDIVDDLLLRVIDAPERRIRAGNEAR